MGISVPNKTVDKERIAEIDIECDKILASSELNPVEKVRGIDQLIKPSFIVKSGKFIDESDSENTADTKADPTNPNLKTYSLAREENQIILTKLADAIRDMVRESAWGGSEPISLKEAMKNPGLFDEKTWDLLESWIDHDRDYQWNYINLVQFNLRYNRKSDDSGFWLSPQHFRMAAIIDTVGREIDENGPKGFDLDLAKSIYKNVNQIPQSITNSIATLRHQ